MRLKTERMPVPLATQQREIWGKPRATMYRSEGYSMIYGCPYLLVYDDGATVPCESYRACYISVAMELLSTRNINTERYEGLINSETQQQYLDRLLTILRIVAQYKLVGAA